MLNKDFKNKLFSYFSIKLGARVYRRGWLKCNCPDCGRVDKFGINLWKDITNCFVCGYNPSPFRLVMDLEGIEDYKEARKLLGVYNDKIYYEPEVERIETVDVELPEGYTNLSLGNNKVAKLARSYVIKRGFDVEKMAMKGWGYCTSGDYLGYLVIPFYIKNKLIYYNARKYFGTGSKYKNPNIEEFGVGKSLILYNFDALAIYKDIYLAEGVINAETIGDNALATGGKKISHYQISLINRSRVQIVKLALDPDALHDSIRVAMELVFLKKVKLIWWEGNEDVNDIGYKRFKEIEDNTDYVSYNDLIKLRNKIDAKRSIHSY